MFGPNVENGKIRLEIDGSINQVQTKANASGFQDKDAIGLYAVNYTDGNSTPGSLLLKGNQADNAKYIFQEEDMRWSSTRAVYYKDVKTNVDLYLYYPYQSTIEDINASSFEIKPDQNVIANGAKKSGYEMSDILWGKATNVTPTESKVPVLLNHIMSSVAVKLVQGTGFEDGEWESLAKSVVVVNTTLTSTIDFATGVVTPVGEPQQKGIVMADQEDDSYRAIVVPQTVKVGVQFAITLGTSSYQYYNRSSDTQYVSGKISTYDITVNKKSATGDYELTLSDSQITDWVADRNVHGGEARQYFVVNVDTKGNLGKIIKAAGKNPDRIRNLKVTGQIDMADFRFMRDSMKILEAVNLKECRTYGAYNDQNCYSYWFGNDEQSKQDLINQYGNPDRIDIYEDGSGSFYYYQNKDWDVIPLSAFADKKSLSYFAFPESVKYIAQDAFVHSGLSGALIIPDDVVEIGHNAFNSTDISSVSFGDCLTKIGDGAFIACSSLTGDLLLPESLSTIGNDAFNGCNFKGRLALPENLERIGSSAFNNSGKYQGDLEIPERIQEIPDWAFASSSFTGSLNLNNVTKIASYAFYNSGFKGELILPEGITDIEAGCFQYNAFSTVVFPSTLKRIGNNAFDGNWRLTCALVFPEGLISIGEWAFSGCGTVTAIELPSTIQTIKRGAFNSCHYVSRIVCNAIEPPIVQDNSFDGVQKDNFTVEVPSQSVKRYMSEVGWSDFKRISAHYDFSISRNLMRGLNAEVSRTFVLRAPAGYNWSIQDKPDWVTVTPSSGTGKTDVTVTFSKMERTSNQFYYEQVDEWGNTSGNSAAGRAGEIVFSLDDKDYTSSMAVQQFDCDYGDGHVVKLNTATKGAGIDIVFLGEGYDARDIAMGTYLNNANEGFGHFFDIEPYKTYKDYFNVYAVVSMSYESGIGTVNTVIDNKFGTYFTQNRILAPDMDKCFEVSKIANPALDVTESLTILLMNTSVYEGVTMMGYDNSAVACCPVSREPYPYDFRGIIQHEAGGHGFGKLGDEYIYHNAFIQTCACICCDHPQSDDDLTSSYGIAKYLGWYKNLSMKSSAYQVPWAHLIYNEQFSDYVDMYEGGYMHSRGMFRSEATSCMNNNIPYYSAISRQAIVERIKQYAGEEFTLEEFYEKDSSDFGTKAAVSSFDRTFGVDPTYVRASGRAPIFVDRRK